MPTPRPALSCRSCGSFEALPGGELCPACRHAVEVHGASFVDAYAVPCEGCDRPQIQTSPEAPIPCVNCHSPACEWPGECDDEAECVAEEILDILNDLIEWDAYVGPHENEVWTRARAIRDRLVVK
jgi:hypothetical protein